LVKKERKKKKNIICIVNSHKKINSSPLIERKWDNVVDIATTYELEGAGLDSRWGKILSLHQKFPEQF
jgi:hypothetical protein